MLATRVASLEEAARASKLSSTDVTPLDILSNFSSSFIKESSMMPVVFSSSPVDVLCRNSCISKIRVCTSDIEYESSVIKDEIASHRSSSLSSLFLCVPLLLPLLRCIDRGAVIVIFSSSSCENDDLDDAADVTETEEPSGESGENLSRLFCDGDTMVASPEEDEADTAAILVLLGTVEAQT